QGQGRLCWHPNESSYHLGHYDLWSYWYSDQLVRRSGEPKRGVQLELVRYQRPSLEQGFVQGPTQRCHVCL
ncbi:unnamed protein product, partial [Aphanomyces euteiches]